MKVEEFTPQKINGTNYVVFVVQGEECHLCKKTMIKKPKDHWPNNLFPVWRPLTQDKQMERAGFVYRGTVKVDDNPICRECQDNDLATFECAMCNKRHNTSEIEESIGDPAEYLCKTCYASIPAKEWDKKMEELENEHRYDYE